MKKLAFLLSLVLLVGLFAGCGQQVPPTESTQPSTQPASTQSPQPEAPEISVKTDYSQYIPGDNGSKFSRLQEGWIPNLAAGDDYGQIYPFAGALLYSE